MDRENSGFDKSRFIKIEIEGLNNSIWSQWKTKFQDMFTNILELKFNNTTESTVREEIQRLMSNVAEYANAKLVRPSIENEKLLAEITVLMESAVKISAESRKINAEAAALEFENMCNNLRLCLGGAEAFAIMEDNQEAILFCKNMAKVLTILSPTKRVD